MSLALIGAERSPLSPAAIKFHVEKEERKWPNREDLNQVTRHQRPASISKSAHEGVKAGK
jgi:hypothetical protein